MTNSRLTPLVFTYEPGLGEDIYRWPAPFTMGFVVSPVQSNIVESLVMEKRYLTIHLELG